MINEGVTYAELNVAKKSRDHQRKPRGTHSSISVVEQEITYAEFNFQKASPEHPAICRDCCCKGFPCPPEKLIAGTLGIIGFALMVAVVVVSTVTTPYTEAKVQINTSLTTTHRAHPCGCCPKESISYSHNCYYTGVEKKSWNDSLVSCASKNCNLLYIDSEEEQDFLQSLSLVSWAGVFRKSKEQLWVWKSDSSFKPKISEVPYDEYNCAMLSTSGLTADNCTALHTYLCECKLTN